MSGHKANDAVALHETPLLHLVGLTGTNAAQSGIKSRTLDRARFRAVEGIAVVKPSSYSEREVALGYPPPIFRTTEEARATLASQS